MREVIERMLEIERHARGIVAKAEAEAGRLTDAAQAEARLLVERSRQAALAQVDTMIGEAKAAAEKERTEHLAQVRRKFEAERTTYDARVAAVAAGITPLLLGCAPTVVASPRADALPAEEEAEGPTPPGPTGSSA